MKKISSFLIVFFIGYGITKAQLKNNYYVDVSSTDQDAIFDDVLYSLMSSDYFVLYANKDASMIQCKIVPDDRKMFTKLRVAILEYNLLIRNNQDRGVRIYLQANLTQKTRNVNVDHSGVFNDDVGVTDNPKHYEPMIEFLQSHLN